MPPCEPKTQEQREARFECIAGKLLKDWTTRIMKQHGLTRRDARDIILTILKHKAEGHQ